MKKAIAVMLIVLLVMTAAACQGGEATSSQAAPQSTESSQTERSTEETTEAPTTTETPTTEAPTTTEVPTTQAPTTEAPTTTEAAVQPVFRTGLYELKGSWDERPMNKIGSATYYFSDAGQFCCEVYYKDASGSVNTDQVGNYVADGDTLTLYYWFSRGGDPSWNACMYAQDVFTIAGEDLLRKGNRVILDHRPVHDIALADKVRDERVFRLVVDFLGRADLLDAAVGHNDDRIRHRQSFFLIVRDVNECNAGLPLHAFQFDLHVLPKF